MRSSDWLLVSLVLVTILLTSCTRVNDIVGTVPGQLYECNSKTLIQTCPGGLSSGIGTRCYNIEKTGWTYCGEGWKEYVELIDIPIISEGDKPYKSGDYHCYPKLNCCRLYGLLSNPCIEVS